MRLHVASPEETLDKILQGYSLARFGDGECKIMEGDRGFVYFQRGTKALASELRSLIGAYNPASLIGLFNCECEDPDMSRVIRGWHKRLSVYAYPRRQYQSTLVSRLDLFPSLGTPEWFDKFASLWSGKQVTLVANGVRSLTPELLLKEGAAGVDFVACEPRNAYSQIDRLESEALRKNNHIIILCAGMTATCLAERLAQKGRQALDLGHIGRFWRRYEDLPQWRYKHDESARGLFHEDGSVVGNPP